MGRSQITQTTTGDVDEEDEDEEDELIHGRRKRKVSFMPSLGACSLFGEIAQDAKY